MPLVFSFVPADMGLSGFIQFAALSAMVILIELAGSNEAKGMKLKRCNLFNGSWVRDRRYPLYRNCTLVGRGFDCLKNGRPDHGYLDYRWQPLSCDLPRFNGRRFLERMRGKKMMFVGDSLSLNQWESLTCMLHSAVPRANYTLLHRGTLSVFRFPEYGVSIMALKDGFLVDVIDVRGTGRVLKLDSVSRGDMWAGFDVLIFNSFHWWTHRKLYYQLGGRVLRNLNFLDAYRIGMTTWGKWVDSHIDRSKTRVFFQGVSAAHINGSEWGERKATCRRQTEAVEGSVYPGGSNPGEEVLKSVVNGMKHPVELLDITLMTQLRKDGHPSMFAGVKMLDCSHWCVPGVPDTWNELLYTALFYQ